MDRFIVEKKTDTEESKDDLKSSLDRFIGGQRLTILIFIIDLKSSLDRFIEEI